MTLSHISRNVSTSDLPAATDARVAQLEEKQAAAAAAEKEQQQDIEKPVEPKGSSTIPALRVDVSGRSITVIEPRTLSPASYTAAALQGKRLPPSRQRHTVGLTSSNAMTSTSSTTIALPQPSLTTASGTNTNTSSANRVQGRRVAGNAASLVSTSASSLALTRNTGLEQTQLCIDLPPSFTRSTYQSQFEEDEEEEGEAGVKGNDRSPQQQQPNILQGHSAVTAAPCTTSPAMTVETVNNTCTHSGVNDVQGDNTTRTPHTRMAANFASGVMLWRPTQLMLQQPGLSSRNNTATTASSSSFTPMNGSNNASVTSSVSRPPSAWMPHYADHFAAVEVLPGLFLGTKADAASLDELQQRHISLVINVSEDCPVSASVYDNPHHIRIVQFPLKDHSDEAISAYFTPVTTIIHAQLHRRKAYLQSCGLDDTVPQSLGDSNSEMSSTTTTTTAANSNIVAASVVGGTDTSTAAAASLGQIDAATPTAMRQWPDVVFIPPTTTTVEPTTGPEVEKSEEANHDAPLPSHSMLLSSSSSSSQTSMSALAEAMTAVREQTEAPVVVDVRDCGGVLVHCRMGVSRSASLVLAYLILYGTVLASLEKPSELFRHWLRRERRLVERAGGRVCGAESEDADKQKDEDSTVPVHTVRSATHKDNGEAEEGKAKVTKLTNDGTAVHTTNMQNPNTTTANATLVVSPPSSSSLGSASRAVRRTQGSRSSAVETPLSSATTTRTSARTVPRHTGRSLLALTSPVTPRRYAAHSCPACLQLRQKLARQQQQRRQQQQQQQQTPSLFSRSQRRFSATFSPGTGDGALSSNSNSTSRIAPPIVTPMQAAMSLTDLRRSPNDVVQRSATTVSYTTTGTVASRAACRADMGLARRTNLMLPYRALQLNSSLNTPFGAEAASSPLQAQRPQLYGSPLFLRRTPTTTIVQNSTDPVARSMRRQSTAHVDFASRSAGGSNGRTSSVLSSPLEGSTAGMTYREAFEFLKRKKSDINPNIGFVLALRELAAGSDFSLSTSFGDRT